MDLVNLGLPVLFLLLLIYCIALRWRLAWTRQRLASWKAVTRDLSASGMAHMVSVAKEQKLITFEQFDALTAWHTWLYVNGEWK